MTAAKHCDRDPGKTCSSSEVRRQAVLRAEQLVDCDQARKGAPLHTASRIIHGTRMPAACAASALMPAARIS